MNQMLKDAIKDRDFHDDIVTLAKAAYIIRKDGFSYAGFTYSGQFPEGCQENSVPLSLKSLISMVLNGTNLKNQETRESQACLTVCQTILYNMKKKVATTEVQTRHNVAREPPLPLYIGIKVHSHTRSKKLLQLLYSLGLCSSYERIMQLEDWIASSVCRYFEEDGVVAPATLRKGLFSLDALDNLDHNPSSMTSMTSFHGTGISLFQFPTNSNPGTCRPALVIQPSGDKKHCLPESYSSVPAVEMRIASASVPHCKLKEVGRCLDEAIVQENKWTKHALEQLKKETLVKHDSIAWAAYHASLQPSIKEPPCITALFPLFYEKSATPAMIKHGMDIQCKATHFLNPGQIPVTTFDQPLFALAKCVQWTWPNTHGESMHVIMFGGMHTKMALLEDTCRHIGRSRVDICAG